MCPYLIIFPASCKLQLSLCSKEHLLYEASELHGKVSVHFSQEQHGKNELFHIYLTLQVYLPVSFSVFRITVEHFFHQALKRSTNVYLHTVDRAVKIFEPGNPF